MLFANDDLDELEEASENGRLPPPRLATRFDPAPPDVLAPQQTWRTTMSAPGSLADGAYVRVSFGWLVAKGDPSGEHGSEGALDHRPSPALGGFAEISARTIQPRAPRLGPTRRRPSIATRRLVASDGDDSVSRPHGSCARSRKTTRVPDGAASVVSVAA